jgi:hypothetical protein
MLTNGNRELAKDGVFTWTLPALNARLSDGSNFVTCPNAGVCANLCYARSGTFNFSNVKAAHRRNLELIVANDDDMVMGVKWREAMIAELKAKRYRGGKFVRIHDSGDFFSRQYFMHWVHIAMLTHDVTFYAYTKEVAMVKEVERHLHGLPKNLVIIFSMGGKQDHLVDKDHDRHADVFPTLEALESAGYTDQAESDILAATLPTNRIGIVVNNISHLKKRQGNETFASLQELRDTKVSAYQKP